MEICPFHSKHNYNTPTFTEEKEAPSPICFKQYVYCIGISITEVSLKCMWHTIKSKSKEISQVHFWFSILLLFWCMVLEAQVLFRVIDNLIPN